MSKEFKLKELLDYINSNSNIEVELILNGISSEQKIRSVATLRAASNNDLSFYTNTQYRDDILNTKAGVVVIAKKHAHLVSNSACLVADNPHVVYAKLAQLFATSAYDNLTRTDDKSNVDKTVIIGKNCTIADNVYIGPYVVIGDNVVVCEHVVINAGVVVGNNCAIGAYSLLHPKVVLYDKVLLGSHCIIHSGAIIGSDGFGFALTNEKEWLKVPQLGGVEIGNYVEVGANTTIDRGAIENTYIADGVKLDNQIQVAHNVSIDKHTIIAGQAGIAGSSKIGKYCAFGGGSGISGHVNITDGVKLAGFTTVGKSITEPGFYASGTGPALPYSKWRRLTVYFENLDKYVAKLKTLIKVTD